MRRIILRTVASSAVALALPGVAAADNDGHHHRHHHHAHHHRRAEHARRIHFGAPAPPSGSATPPVPVMTPPPATTRMTAGTVTSFTGGKLTITLTDGGTVSGEVTEATEIRCEQREESPPVNQMGGQGNSSPGGPPESNGQNGDSRGGRGPSGNGNRDGNDHGDENDGNGEDNGEAERCTAAALVPGAVVREADLTVSGAGSIWDEVELAQ